MNSLENYFCVEWNADNTRILPPDANFEDVELAIKKYFLLLDPQESLASSENIKKLLHIDGQEQNIISTEQKNIYINSSLFNKLLFLQVANDFLESEGINLEKILQKQGQPFVCSKGCSGCCSQMILCSETEALLIALFLEEHPQEKAQFLTNFLHFDRQAKNIAVSYLQWGQAYYGQGKDDKSHCREDYDIACPFLSSTQTCSIYAVRPYACRSSVAVDARCTTLCPTKKGDRKGMYNMLFSLYTGHHQTRQRIMESFSHRKKDLHKTIVPYMVHDVLQAL